MKATIVKYLIHPVYGRMRYIRKVDKMSRRKGSTPKMSDPVYNYMDGLRYIIPSKAIPNSDGSDSGYCGINKRRQIDAWHQDFEKILSESKIVFTKIMEAH